MSASVRLIRKGWRGFVNHLGPFPRGTEGLGFGPVVSATDLRGTGSWSVRVMLGRCNGAWHLFASVSTAATELDIPPVCAGCPSAAEPHPGAIVGNLCFGFPWRLP